MNPSHVRLLAALLLLVAFTACRSGSNGAAEEPTDETAETSAADEAAATDETAATDEAAEPAEPAATEPEPEERERRPGVYFGVLEQDSTVLRDHRVEVLNDRDGVPQLGIWEFCNIDLQGDGPNYTASEGASCFVDLGDGRKGYLVTVEARMTDERLQATVTFGDGDAVWKYDGRN